MAFHTTAFGQRKILFIWIAVKVIIKPNHVKRNLLFKMKWNAMQPKWKHKIGFLGIWIETLNGNQVNKHKNKQKTNLSLNFMCYYIFFHSFHCCCVFKFRKFNLTNVGMIIWTVVAFKNDSRKSIVKPNLNLNSNLNVKAPKNIGVGCVNARARLPISRWHGMAQYIFSPASYQVWTNKHTIKTRNNNNETKKKHTEIYLYVCKRHKRHRAHWITVQFNIMNKFVNGFNRIERSQWNKMNKCFHIFRENVCGAYKATE